MKNLHRTSRIVLPVTLVAFLLELFGCAGMPVSRKQEEHSAKVDSSGYRNLLWCPDQRSWEFDRGQGVENLLVSHPAYPSESDCEGLFREYAGRFNQGMENVMNSDLANDPEIIYMYVRSMKSIKADTFVNFPHWLYQDIARIYLGSQTRSSQRVVGVNEIYSYLELSHPERGNVFLDLTIQWVGSRWAVTKVKDRGRGLIWNTGNYLDNIPVKYKKSNPPETRENDPYASNSEGIYSPGRVMPFVNAGDLEAVVTNRWVQKERYHRSEFQHGEPDQEWYDGLTLYVNYYVRNRGQNPVLFDPAVPFFIITDDEYRSREYDRHNSSQVLLPRNEGRGFTASLEVTDYVGEYAKLVLRKIRGDKDPSVAHYPGGQTIMSLSLCISGN